MDALVNHDTGPFNTKKVRLKPLDRDDYERLRKPFNTKKVRLKQYSTRPGAGCRDPFNTKKVRLKRGRPHHGRLDGGNFQYQKGAIKTR